MVLWLSGVGASAQLQTQPGPPQTPSANENFIVTFRPGTSQADRAASVRRAGATLRFNYSIVDAVAVTIPNTNVFAAFQRDLSVLEIIPDRAVQAFHHCKGRHANEPACVEEPPDDGGGGGGGGGGSDPQPAPEGVKRVGEPTLTSNGSGIGVAIIDTGIDFNHPDLQPEDPSDPGGLSSTSFSAFGGPCQDDNEHGTHVAGIVGARNNTIDVVGVAPNAKLYCVKVLNSAGSGNDSTVMAGLDCVAGWNGITGNSPCTQLPVGSPPIRVVNMSLGRAGTLNDNPALRLAVQNLYNYGIAVVVSAGNDSSKVVSQMVPAGYPEVFAVASTTAIGGSNKGCRFFSGTIPADTASYFTTDGAFNSTTGIGVTISAPGADKEDVNKPCFIKSIGILSLKLGGGTTRMFGTSMASPHVAGVVARMMQGGMSDVELIRTNIRLNASPADAPLDSPASGYSYDGEQEGIVQAP